MSARLWTSTTSDFSDDRVYRYSLTRTWDESLPTCVFIMLNPSTADEEKDDPTVRRCLGYAHAWGFGRLIVVNLFALRATDPKDLYQHPFSGGGERNWKTILAACGWQRPPYDRPLVVCAWGQHGKYYSQGKLLARLLRHSGIQMYALNVLASGEPAHPLYLPADLKPELFP